MENSGSFSSTADSPLPNVVGTSAAMLSIARRVRQVAPCRSSVLIVGETGTGKELIARAIHEHSPRVDGPYIRINCGALSEGLLESELFGHVKGAFTGAVDNKTGRFEASHGGTIFLDEINSMSAKLQVKLLRVLQEREFERVGESRTIRVDVRVIAATNEYLEDEIREERFREDLYYRLNVVPVYLPPLRERVDDIEVLVKFFIQRYAKENKKAIKGITDKAMARLMQHNWPGNVRELEHTIERAVVLTQTPMLEEELFLPQTPLEAKRLRSKKQEGSWNDAITQLVDIGMRLDESEPIYPKLVTALEKELIQQVLKECDGVQVKAANRLGINRNTLYKKMQEFGLAEEG